MFYETLITIMKKNIWIWALAAVTLVTACSKNDDPVTPEPEQNVTEDDFESPDGQVVIQLGAGDYTASANTTVTRAPLTNATFAGNTIIGIYGVSTTGVWTEATNMLLNNRKAKVTDVERNAEQGADVSKTNPDGNPAVTGPYKISLYNTEGITEGQVEYYPMISDKNYAFYGYSPYNNTAISSGNSASVAFEDFNGSQDIIWGKSVAPQIKAGSIWAKSDYTPNQTAIDGYNAKYIRMLKYHYELNSVPNHGHGTKDNYPWIPNIAFTHKLVQFKFYIVPAKEQSTVDKENAKKLFVSNIRLQNHGIPTLFINDGKITFNGDKPLQMLSVTSGVFNDTSLKESVHPDDNQIVGYLLVKPGLTEYDLLIDISPFNPNLSENTDQKQRDIPVKIRLSDGHTFDAGCSYNIKIGIYAMQEVEADASLTDWTDKGDVNIDVE